MKHTHSSRSLSDRGARRLLYNYIRFTWFFAASYSIGTGEGKSYVLLPRWPSLTKFSEPFAELAQPLLLDTKKLIERAQAKWPEQVTKVMDEYERNPLEPAMLQEAKVRIMGASLGFTTVLTPAYRWLIHSWLTESTLNLVEYERMKLSKSINLETMGAEALDVSYLPPFCRHFTHWCPSLQSDRYCEAILDFRRWGSKGKSRSTSKSSRFLLPQSVNWSSLIQTRPLIRALLAQAYGLRARAQMKKNLEASQAGNQCIWPNLEMLRTASTLGRLLLTASIWCQLIEAKSTSTAKKAVELCPQDDLDRIRAMNLALVW